MIQTVRAVGQPQPRAWARQLAAAIRDPAVLLARLGLEGLVTLPSPELLASFPLLVTEAYLARIRHGDPDDPLLRQVLPVATEGEPGGSRDPVREAAALVAPGVLRKYAGRALLVTTAACAIHCRYCFRRHYPYDGGAAMDWGPALAAAAADPGVDELILSGGDPLVLSDRRLAELSSRLHEVPNLRRLRLHSRLPVVLPDRIDDGFLAWAAAVPLPTVMVIHANHPDEIGEDVAAALARLRGVGMTLLNQSVLLRGVNDTVAVLEALSLRLFEVGVLPYYLHQLDPVAGAMHFEVPDERAREIQRGLAAALPGYLVPRLVRELPGAASKLPL